MEENQNEELEIQHRLYIEEEEINISELPNEIKQMMRSFNAKLKKYEETEDEEVENVLFLELQQDDVAIADNILTWWEDYNSEDEDEEDFEKEEDEETVNNEQKPVEQKPVEQKPVEQKPVEQKPVEQKPVEQKTIEQKVLDLAKDNIISFSDLENLIGRKPDYPDHFIGKLKLRKQHLRPFYEIKNM